MTNLSEAWFEGYSSFETGDTSLYQEGTKEQDDFEWGYSCAISDDESYAAWLESEGPK